MKPLRLSHSSIETYNTCPQKYKLHYIDKIRSDYLSSPLFFGKAIDGALNILLIAKKKDLNLAEQEMSKLNVYATFDASMHYIEINGEIIFAPLSDRLDYFNTDCNLEILTKDDIISIETLDFNYLDDTSGTNFDSLVGLTKNDLEDFVEFYQKNNKLKLPKSYKKVYNYICWLSLRRKGAFIIEAYKEHIIPQILEVHTIQEEVNLPNPSGDYITGFIDFIATWSDGKKYVFDNKTSSRPYKEDSVTTSQQLSIYSEYLGFNLAGYIVMIKEVRKKGPKIKIQVVIDEIPDETYQKVFDKIGEVSYNIKNEKFSKDLNKCFQFGKPCQYFQYCRNGSVDGLKKLK